MRHLLVDITRTIMRASHAAPTGIDRVERAYIEWALGQSDYQIAFICRIKGGQAVFDRATGERIYRDTAFRPVSESGFTESATQRRLRRLQYQANAFWCASSWFRTVAGGRKAFERLGLDPTKTTILNVSHNNIDPWALGLLKQIGIAKIVAFIHDVIPVDYPEFVAPGAPRRFGLKLDALAKHADGFIFNSQYTAERTLAQIAARTPRQVEATVAHLGLSNLWDTPYDGPPMSEHPYFVTLGTIEPRKNHLLLLNVWRRLSEICSDPPHLHVIGWRGWENENILDFLDRSTIVGKTVFEHPSDSDDRVKGWVAGARAVLYPSFVEGFGIPIVEALASGTPVICSDLSVLREVGGGAPDYVDPLDGPGWVELIRHYCDETQPHRSAQLERLTHYKPPCWGDHLVKAEQLLERLR